MKRPPILDANGATLSLGDKIDGGDGVVGIVSRFHEPDMSHWLVAVTWQEWPDAPEVFSTQPLGWDYEAYQCSDIERLA